jgi:hypothetical protein
MSINILPGSAGTHLRVMKWESLGKRP